MQTHTNIHRHRGWSSFFSSRQQSNGIKVVNALGTN